MESGKRLPRASTVERLAEVLRVSPAWLGFGLGDEQEADAALVPRWEGIATRMKSIRGTNGLSLSEVGRRAGSSAAAVRALEFGSDPTLDTIELLAKALRVSPAWLGYGLEAMETTRRRTYLGIEPS